MIDPRIFIQEPTPFEQICRIYPPSVREVVVEDNFSLYLRLLTITQEELEESAKKEKQRALTPFEFLFNCAYNDEKLKKAIQSAFYFFIKEPINFLFEEKKIIVGDLEKVVQNIDNLDQLRFLTENNYFNFQNEIRLAVGQKAIKPPVPIDPNEDPRIRRMKELARKRDAIKAKQGSKDGITLTTSLVAICCMGIGITPLNIGELSYASIGPIMNTMQEKEKYDIDVRSLLAGADSKKVKPKYWIRNKD